MPDTAKLFMNGRSQAVRLPAEFRFPGTEVEIRRDMATGGVLLTAKQHRTGSWDAFLAAVATVPESDKATEGFPWRDQDQTGRDDPFA